jgi:mRNA interferase MazF
MEIARGDVVTIAMQGHYGKPRPALVVQADPFQLLDSVTVLRLSSDLRALPLFRITIEPKPSNGLQKRSQIMIDKAATVPRAKIGQCIGRADAGTMRAVYTALAGFLGLS